MPFDDLAYGRDGLGFRFYAEIEDDAGAWVDLNAPFPSTATGSAGDYWSCLLRRPAVSIESDSGAGIYYAKASNLTVDNRAWNGNAYGFWDAPLPVSIKRATTHTFSTFRRRRLRLRVDVFGQDGMLLENVALGIFSVEGVATSEGDEATLRLVGRQKVLMDKSAALVKHGGEPYRSMPIGALVRLLIKSTDPNFGIGAGIGDTLLDLGETDVNRASSWGSCPGVLTDGTPSAHRWIPRCFGRDTTNANIVVVGFEVPGSDEATSGGAIALFDTSTGRWQIVATPANGDLNKWRPILVWKHDTYQVRAVIIRERNPYGGAANVITGFYYLAFVSYSVASGVQTAHVPNQHYWPARFGLRRGTLKGSYPNYMRVIGGTTGEWYGENAAQPFVQMIDSLHGYIDQSYGTTDHLRIARWYGYRTDVAEVAVAAERMPLLTTRGGAYEHYITTGNVQASTGGFRFFLTDSFHPPFLLGQTGTAGDPKWIYWITNVDHDWRIYRCKSNSPYTLEWFGLDNLKDAASPGTPYFYNRQISAYTAAGALYTGEQKIMIATIEWRDAQSLGQFPFYTRAVLFSVDLAGVSPGTQVPSGNIVLRWSDAPAGDNKIGWTVLGLWTAPFAPENDWYHQTHRYVMVVFCGRIDCRSGPYTVGIWDGSTNGWVAKPTYSIAYNGPRSSRPFAGFTYCEEDERFYFIDQATGQVWSVAPAVADWRLENKALAIHASEHHVATHAGISLLTDAVNQRYTSFWGMAPGPHGDVTTAYWERAAAQPASMRYVKGLYPLVQLSRKPADAIEVADFRELKVWDALRMLRQVAYKYTMFLDLTDTFQLKKRQASTPILTLKLESLVGYVAAESGEFAIQSYSKQIAYDQMKNAVEITPYEITLNDAENPLVVRGSGSEYGGEFLVAIDTERPLRLAITCVEGGDVYSDPAIPTTEHALLWRYSRVLETVQTYLTVMVTNPAQTYIYVANFSQKGGLWYCGETPVRLGDKARLQDGDLRGITAITLEGQTAVKLSLDGVVGATGSAYAAVEIIPSESASASDSDEGLTTLAQPLGAAQGDLTAYFVDASPLRVPMALRVDDELIVLDSIRGNEATVTRGNWGTTRVAHVAGAAVKAYVYTAVNGILYIVGDTGVRFGFMIEYDATKTDEESVRARTIVKGDGVVLESKGFALKPVEHAVVHGVDSDSVKLYDSEQTEQITDNRFLDVVKADALKDVVLAEKSEPRMALEISIPFIPGMEPGATVRINASRIGAGNIDFEVVGLAYDWNQRRIKLRLRSFAAVAGAGKAPVTPPAGYAVPRGERAEYEEVP